MQKAIEAFGCLLCVDIEKTIEYYKSNPVCNCLACRNYRAQVKEKLPQAMKYLVRFGIDISRPDETEWYETDRGIEYTAFYTAGCADDGDPSCEKELQGIVLDDAAFFEFAKEYVPNYWSTPCYTFKLSGIILPYLLEEPFIKPKKSFFSRLSAVFGKNTEKTHL